ncbi:hypothetical protein P8452_24312 [Trifolium repens]|nr:hypothetical protein P8452_24312 [Trifolium repens]
MRELLRHDSRINPAAAVMNNHIAAATVLALFVFDYAIFQLWSYNSDFAAARVTEASDGYDRKRKLLLLYGEEYEAERRNQFNLSLWIFI